MIHMAVILILFSNIFFATLQCMTVQNFMPKACCYQDLRRGLLRAKVFLNLNFFLKVFKSYCALALKVSFEMQPHH